MHSFRATRPSTDGSRQEMSQAADPIPMSKADSSNNMAMTQSMSSASTSSAMSKSLSQRSHHSMAKTTSQKSANSSSRASSAERTSDSEHECVPTVSRIGSLAGWRHSFSATKSMKSTKSFGGSLSIMKKSSTTSSEHRTWAPICTQYFPMYVVKVSDAMAMEEVQPHQELVRQGKVVEYEEGMRVMFISHQWTSWDHPDKAAEQFRALRMMLKGVEGREINVSLCPCISMYTGTLTPQTKQEHIHELIEDGYLWYDYFSVPQPAAPNPPADCEQSLHKAVDSIPYYIEHCNHFLLLVPFVQHQDNMKYLCLPSYLDRGWCRAEVAAWALSGVLGRPGLLAWAPGSLLEGGVIHWLLHPPKNGNFSSEADRYRVDHIIDDLIMQRVQVALDHDDVASYHLFKAISVNYTMVRRRVESDLDQWMLSYQFQSVKDWSGGWSPIHYAALEGNCTIIKKLVAAGLSVNLPTRKGRREFASYARMTAAHIAALYLNTDLGVKVLVTLRDLGASFKARDLIGQTVLHTACAQRQRQAMIDIILDQDVDIEAQTYMGDTALSLASQMANTDTCEHLLIRGAKATVTNMMGATPLFQASIFGRVELIDVLLKYGADPNHANNPYMPAAMQFMGSTLTKVRPQAMLSDMLHGCENRTALMMAAITGNAGAVDRLLKAGADPYMKNKSGQDAFDHATSFSKSSQVVQLLSDKSESSTNSYPLGDPFEV
eukprot:TRINITY_DN14453_c1_g1_i1.p1 TRINITY_DN14453_c1_g1~~TRINITY_DN14453_c1_g1_i1.p1  ORF type:complete len:718 (-),score=122.70 TRINITY_DN14453_c1_g1_i1:463-2616(-)